MMIYIGDGEFIPGIPARDLSEAEVKIYGVTALLLSGLYREDKITKRKTKSKDGK